ncbi:MAG: AAA family ATPase [Candidatus Altiarchaeota archaeon]
MIITIGGSAASGKTTLARKLARILKYKHISAGGIMREMAAERGQSLMEFSRYAEKNPKVDVEIDRRQIKLARGNCVVDGRLSAYFIKADLKIWLTATVEVRARRIKNRDNFKTLKDAVKHIKLRESSERKRYMRIYGIKHPDLGRYDIILDTGKFGINATIDVIAKAVETMRR